MEFAGEAKELRESKEEMLEVMKISLSLIAVAMVIQFGSVMKSLVITDSIEPTEAVRACANIRIVPTAPMFAQAILNIWNGTSVSSLFETDTLVPIYEGMYSR